MKASWADIQRRVGVTADGVPGPATLAAIAAALGVETPTRPATGLSDPGTFFAAVRRTVFGNKLEQQQVDGLNALLAAIGAAGWPIGWAAYGLATAAWETNRTMQPVREAYWLDEGYRRRTLRYYPHYGRGYVQITWERNYRLADDELGLGGRLIADLDLAMDPAIAAQILVRGMEEGWFTGKKLADVLPATLATPAQFVAARPIINGTDKATEISKLALSFQEGLRQGLWGETSS